MKSRSITVHDAGSGRSCIVEVPYSYAPTWQEAHRAALDFSETREALWFRPSTRPQRQTRLFLH